MKLFKIPVRKVNHGKHEGIIRFCRLVNNNFSFKLTILKNLFKNALFFWREKLLDRNKMIFENSERKLTLEM